MPDVYVVREGDTWSTIAAKVYGDDQDGQTIQQANPGVSEPLTPGQSVSIPPTGANPAIGEAQPDETVLSIGGQRFRFWEDVTIVQAIDMVPTVELSAPWTPTDPTLRQAFKPFSYKAVTVQVGDKVIFSGTLVGVLPASTPTESTLTASAYARAGVLGDCTAPASAYPDAVQFNGVKLDTIARRLAKLFGLKVEIVGDMGASFERVSLQPATPVLAFLTDLAAQRNALLSANASGDLLIHRANPNSTPVARLSEGRAPVMSVTPTFNEQQHYSHVTGIEPVVVGLAGSQYTVRNAALTTLGTIRPFTYEVPDSISGDVQGAVQTKAGRMYAATVAYSVQVATWSDPSGNLFEPNTIVTLVAPGAMVYQETRLLVRSVEFSQSSKAQTAMLDLVLPESLNGQIPEVLPWRDS